MNLRNCLNLYRQVFYRAKIGCSVTVDVHSSAVIEFRDVPHPDHKFSHLEMLILAACGLTKSAGTDIVFHNFVTVDVRSSAVIEYRDVLHPGHKFPQVPPKPSPKWRGTAFTGKKSQGRGQKGME